MQEEKLLGEWFANPAGDATEANQAESAALEVHNGRVREGHLLGAGFANIACDAPQVKQAGCGELQFSNGCV